MKISVDYNEQLWHHDSDDLRKERDDPKSSQVSRNISEFLMFHCVQNEPNDPIQGTNTQQLIIHYISKLQRRLSSTIR